MCANKLFMWGFVLCEEPLINIDHDSGFPVVCVYIMWNPLLKYALKAFSSSVLCQLTHTAVVCAHTVVMCAHNVCMSALILLGTSY